MAPGVHLLKCLLQTFADNKIVEDVHNKIRLDAKSNANKRQTDEHIQDIVNNCGLPRMISYGAWRQEYKSQSHTGILLQWQSIMGRKTWGTLAEA